MTDMGAWATDIHGRIAVALEKFASMQAALEGVELPDEERRDLLAPYRELVDSLYMQDLPLARLLDESDLVIGAAGERIVQGRMPVDTVVALLRDTKTRVMNVAKSITDITGRVPQGVQPSLYGFAPGSVYVGFNAPIAPDESIFGDDTPYFAAVREALRAIGVVSQLVATEASDEEIVHEIPDPGVRDATLEAVRELAPSGRTAVERVFVAGRGALGSSDIPAAALDVESRRRLTRDRDKPMSATRAITLIGTIREMDLDKKRFYLRQIDSLDPDRSIRGVYSKSDLHNPSSLLDRRVRVTGLAESDNADRPKLLFVQEVEVLGDDSVQGEL